MEMLRSRIILAVMFCAGMFMMTGCTTRLGDFTAISTKNVDVSGVKPVDRFFGEDCVSIILWPYISLGTVNWKNGMDQALERGKGDIMVDVVLTEKSWGIPLIYGQNCILIEGTVSQTASYRR